MPPRRPPLLAAVSATVALLVSLTGGAAFTPSVPATVRRAAPPLRAAPSDAPAPDSRARVLLLGPGFLQLVLARSLVARGYRPVVVAPQAKLDSFARLLGDGGAALLDDALIGLPDDASNGFGAVDAVVFCSEEAVYGPEIIGTVLEWGGYAGAGGPRRAIACTPLTDPIEKERSPGWIPIFNNDKKEAKVWADFVAGWRQHPVSSGAAGTLLRFGSLFGGGPDGPPELVPLGLDECAYKMSLENYRDMRERAFDRFRLGAQVLRGDATNRRPEEQQGKEKAAIDGGEALEAFRVSPGYPEQDRACRHTVAQAVCHALDRTGTGGGDFAVGDVPDECTVLSVCAGALPTEEQWDGLFRSPGAAPWPDPTGFVMPVQPEEREAEER